MARKKYTRARRQVRKFTRKLNLPISKVKYRNLVSGTHSFQFKYYERNFLQVEMNGLDSFFSRVFRFNEIADFGNLVALFDLYKITSVTFQIRPRQGATMHYQTAAGTDDGGTIQPNVDFGGTNLYGVSNFGMSNVVTVIDFNDANTPADIDELMEYSTVKFTTGNRIHTRRLVPKINVDLANTGLNVSRKWLDTTKNDVEHYGIKGGVINVPSITPNEDEPNDHPVMNFDMLVIYNVQCKNTH